MLNKFILSFITVEMMHITVHEKTELKIRLEQLIKIKFLKYFYNFIQQNVLQLYNLNDIKSVRLGL